MGDGSPHARGHWDGECGGWAHMGEAGLKPDPTMQQHPDTDIRGTGTHKGCPYGGRDGSGDGGRAVREQPLRVAWWRCG